MHHTDHFEVFSAVRLHYRYLWRMVNRRSRRTASISRRGQMHLSRAESRTEPRRAECALQVDRTLSVSSSRRVRVDLNLTGFSKPTRLHSIPTAISSTSVGCRRRGGKRAGVAVTAGRGECIRGSRIVSKKSADDAFFAITRRTVERQIHCQQLCKAL